MTPRFAEPLVAKFHDRTAHLGVIGLGYVGLPLAISMAKAGFRVTGFELDAGKVAALMAGKSYIIDVADADVKAMVAAGRLVATTDMSALADVDSVNICVPTPLGKTKDPDISYIQAAMDAIQPHVHPGMLVILESTTYPGTTEEVIVPMLEGENFHVGEQFFAAFSPERVDPGNPTYQTHNIPKVVGGVTPACTLAARTLYEQFMETVVPVSSVRVAETVKLLENTFRSVNIGLVNEMALMCDAMGIDVWEVIEGAATKPFGFMPFFPGPGLGGHCIPIDPFYLSWKAKQAGVESRFIELAGVVNGSMPRHVVGLVAAALNRSKKAVNGSRILVVGVAYKANIDDTRESPAIDVMNLLARQGGRVCWFDPFVHEVHGKVEATRETAFDAATLGAYDVAVVVTGHRDVDYATLVAACPAIVDTRNVLKAFTSDTIIKL
ncbi:MAG: nucleotide sugar dehydrogenase [Candidatus Krumholzibacteriia bacterium]